MISVTAHAIATYFGINSRTAFKGMIQGFNDQYTAAFPDHETIDGVLEPVTHDGETHFVALDERERGSVAPFYAVYRDADREVRYGFCCGNCNSLSVEMNTMGTIACGECGNRRTPTRWDAAYI